MSKTIKYQPEVDGLRAIAVLSVVLYHGHFSFFSGGFIGVDIFFVISGYLITKLIMKDLENGDFNIVGFYDRRLRRILPVLFTVVIVSIIGSLLLLSPKGLLDFSKSVFVTPLFITNIFFWRSVDYFSTDVELLPLIHLWSLSVEEQFYIFFPAFLIILYRFKNNFLYVGLLSIFVISILLAAWGVENTPAAAFYLLPTRMWELLIGSFCAIFIIKGYPKAGTQLSNFLSFVGIILIGFSIIAFDNTIRPPGVYMLFPLIGVAIILLYSEGTFVQRVLSHGLLTHIGLLSYSMYLWHNLFFVLYRQKLNSEFISPDLVLIIVFITYIISLLSWRFIEQPFRKVYLVSHRVFYSTIVFMTLFLLLFGSLGYYTNGFESLYLKYRLTEEQRQFYDLIQKHSNYDMYEFMADDKQCVFWSPQINKDFLERYNECSNLHDRAIVILGDSHGMNVFNIFAKARVAPFIVGLSQGGCRPHDMLPECQYDDFRKFILSRRKGEVEVIYHQSGSYFIRDEDGYVDSTAAFTNGSSFSFHNKNIDETLQYLMSIQDISKVTWLGPFKEARVYFKTLDFILESNYHLNANSSKIFGLLDDLLIREAENQGVDYISFDSIHEINKDFFVLDDCVTYRDKDHFSRCGEDLLANKLQKSFNNLFN